MPAIAAIRPLFSRAVHRTSGVYVAGPPMLRPRDLDQVLAAARARAKQRDARGAGATPPATPAVPMPTMRGLGPGHARGGTAPAQGPPRRTQSVQSPASTGINPWWQYQEENLPGGGHVMVNVGTGNMVVQDDDMAVPHKGVALAFRRTYNSRSQHDTAGTDGAVPSMYGNGWTNTFDAHLSGSRTGTMSVWDVDGARYDYTVAADGVTMIPPPGQHATLTSDGATGYFWTKKSGMIYYFWAPDGATAWPSSVYQQYGAYAGRLYQIIGRNRFTYLTFAYTWDNGNSAAGGKISAIAARAESGLTATLSFADVSGQRLLQQILFPDGVTSVSYSYDAQGNLAAVSRPPNNAGGSRPVQLFGYMAFGGGSVLHWAASPRWCGGTCGADGAFTAFGYGNATVATSTLIAIWRGAVVNPVISDGTGSGALQPGYSTTGYYADQESYTTGVATPTFRDTNGHAVNWVVDSLGRPTQTQQCTATTNQGAQCTGTWLVSNHTWDAANNLVSEVDPRGGTTQMVYDPAGNVVAIAQPPQYPGYNPPTTLIDYDGFSNVTAVCDPVLVHSITADYWSGQYSAGADNYCSSLFGTTNHPYAQYSYPSNEPYGELASVTSATGYTRSISYQPGPQGGLDTGLPTNVSGATVQQFDGSSRRPSVSASYDANGNLVCVQADASTPAAAATATTVMTYDSLNRMVASADPDDASLTGSCSTKAAGIAGSAIVTTQTYFPDGSVATTQTPSEAALNYKTAYTYDLDGNPTAEVPNYPGPQTARAKRWFDGMDRLVETQQPADPGTPGDIPISLRYFYDLSQGGTATTLAGVAVTAHGNLFDVVKNTPTGWTDFNYSAFDSADRVTTAYAFAPCPAQLGPPAPAGAIYCAQAAYSTRYDWDSSPSLNPGVSAPGLLVATLDAMGATRRMTYDGLGSMDTANYADGTVGHTYWHDIDGRLAQADTISFGYNSDGTTAWKYIGDGGSGGTSLAYSYYPDSLPAGLSATTSRNSTGDTVNQPNLFSYAYRNDGRVTGETFGVSGQSVAWTYTRGGRMTAMNDFNSTPSITAQYADGHGRLSSYVTPSGTYGNISYDAQGRPIQYTDPYTRLDGETVNSTYNIRGDLIARTFSGGVAASKPGFQYKNIQGVLVQNANDQYDGRTGAALVTNNSGAFQYDQIGRLTSGGGTFTYDDESRLTSGDTWNASSAGDADCHSGGAVAPGFPPPPEHSYYYDGLGQVAQDTLQSGGSRRWVWNGSAPLYVMPVTYAYNGASGPGAPYGFAADGVGFLTPDGSAPGLTISDPDFDGAVAQYHNSTGHSSWAASNPYNQFCQHATPLPASAGYGQISAQATPVDGLSDRSVVVSSYGRGYLSRSMGFTTPDYSSATPYSGGHSRGLLGRYDNKDGCDIGYGWDTVTEKCLQYINDPPTPSQPPEPWDCDASSPQCGFVQTGGGDPFGYSGPRQFGFRAQVPMPPQTTKSCNGSPQGFAIPPNAPGIPLAFDAGRVHGGGKAAVGANVGSGGMFDYQRYGLTGPNSGYNSAWVPASNFVVGVYMNGAGVSVISMDAQGSIYSQVKKEPTPLNALAKDVPLWNAGWGWAAANCH